MEASAIKGEQYFIVTVDVEADDAWNSPEKIELKNLAELPRFHDMCEEYSVIPTYLVTYECATRDEAISILKPIADTGNCEIGHHLHCWTTPPFQKEGSAGVDAAWVHAYQSELPDSLFMEKAEVLRVAIEKTYARSPASHRAGRWGIDQRSLEWLIENGFKADSSVVPLMSYSRNMGRTKGGSSFYSAPRAPYLYKGKSIHENHNASLIEIPVSIYIPRSFLSRLCASYIRRELPGHKIVDHLFRTIGGTRILRPDHTCPPGVLVHMVENVIEEDLPILNLVLHSSELALGCSPSSSRMEDRDRVWQSLEEVFKYIKGLGIKTSSLSGASTILKPTLA